MRELGYFLNVDKPAGVTSRAVVDRVGKLIVSKRVGHAGTLDPLATGVLVIAVERATRLVEYVQAQEKTYDAEFQLGQSSDTEDITGQITQWKVTSVPSRSEVIAALSEFVGTISQRPPVVSALKVKGKPAYERHREGEELEMAPRPVVVHRIDLLSYQYPALTVRVRCGSGTYIRSIARDLGEKLRTGGLMSQLRRTAIGVFRIEEAHNLGLATGESLLAGKRPLADGIALVEKVRVTEVEALRLAMGQTFAIAEGPATGGEVGVVDGEGNLLGIAHYDPTRRMLKPKKGGFCSSERASAQDERNEQR